MRYPELQHGGRLIQSYVADRYFVSTIERNSSAMLETEMSYFETIIWEWDSDTRNIGKMLNCLNSGIGMTQAIKSHAAIVISLVKPIATRSEGGI